MFRRYRIVRQDDQSDCGAAALATIALHHGASIGVQRLRDLAGTDRVGTNLGGMVLGAQRLGLKAKAVKGPYEALVDVPMPAIAHIKTKVGAGHFVVLYRVTRKHVLVGDPAHGVQKLSRESFCQQWTGYLVIITGSENQKLRAHDGATISAWQRLLNLLSQQKAILTEAFLCALLMTFLGIATSYFVQHLVDTVLVRGETQLLNALGVGMLLVVLFRTLLGVIRGYVLAHVSRRIDLILISSYARQVLGLPMRFFDMRRVGEILSRVRDATKVREAISGTALTALVDGVMVVISLSFLWLYDMQLAAVATVFAPLMLLSVAAHHVPIRSRSREVMEEQAGLSAHLVEDISGVETLKSYGLEELRAQEGEARLVRIVQSVFTLQKLSISMTSTGVFVTGIAGIVTLWYGGHRVIDGALTVGQLMFAYTLLGYLLEPLERLASVNLKIQDALVAVDRLYQIMDLEAEDLCDTRKARFQSVDKLIQLKDVSFQYGCREKVLDKVNLEIPAGATVAIVGESGSGKSTILKLLMRLHDPVEGQVLVDGLDLRDYDLESLRARIGVVSQEPFVFNGTIRDNIALGHAEATMDDIVSAAKMAGLAGFISRLPDRYDTLIGERGANLSGGQRQRLAIARALVRKPDILIFDEATSHLDTATERAIRNSLATVLSGTTAVLVAHRLSTIREADIIYVLDDGQVVEQGNHAELMVQGGVYASLCQAQTDQQSVAIPPVAASTNERSLPCVARM